MYYVGHGVFLQFNLPISKACTVFYRSDTGIVVSNFHTQDMDIDLPFHCVCAGLFR
jgi:hypothetical protein